MLLFSTHYILIKNKIIPPLDKKTGGLVVFALLRYGFWISVITIIFGLVVSIRGWFPDTQAYKFEQEINTSEDVNIFLEFLEGNTGRIVYIDTAISRNRAHADHCTFGFTFKYPRPSDMPEDAEEEKDVLCIYVFMPNEVSHYEIGQPNPHGVEIYGNHGDILVKGFFSVGGAMYGGYGGFQISLYSIDRISGHDRIGRRT